jgi:hypothetical protein
MNPKETDGIQLAQDIVKWRTFVKTVNEPAGFVTGEEFLD